MTSEFSYDRIIEGRCPKCDTPLERREHCGWCPQCNFGHAIRLDPDGTGVYSLTIEPRIPGSMRLTTTDGSIIESTINVVRIDKPLS